MHFKHSKGQSAAHWNLAAVATEHGDENSPPQQQVLAQPILCEAGSVIVFDKDLLHAGGPNLSSGIRYALYARMRFSSRG